MEYVIKLIVSIISFVLGCLVTSIILKKYFSSKNYKKR